MSADCQECNRLQRAWDKSEAEVAALRLERDRLLATCGQWSETEKVRRRERDEARQKVARLRGMALIDQGAILTASARAWRERMEAAQQEAARLTAEVERLRATIEGAPHGPDCYQTCPLGRCICWKSRALLG